MSIFRKARVIVPALALLFVSVSLSAQSWGPNRWNHGDHRTGYVAQTLQQLLAQAGDKGLNALTAADIRKALGEISIARQKAAYVRRSEVASFLVPGAGQFMNHAAGAGALFLGGHLAVAAGTLIGAYYLLPSDLQFGTTNYFTDSFSTIRTRWLDHSLVNYLPSAAVLAGGMLVDHIIRRLAAQNAGELARENIKSQKVVFQPEPFMLIPGPRGPFVGFGWRMRF